MTMVRSWRTGRAPFFSRVLTATVFLTAAVLAAGPLVDINTASVEELQSLPGIGPALARRIISEREANGPFNRPEEITRVFGIGEARYRELRDLITAGPAGAPDTRVPPPQPINLNTATQAELETLPGIGPVLARRIIDYREQKRRFGRPEDLKEVRGIGPKTVEALKNLVTVSGGALEAPAAGLLPPPPAGPRDLKCWRCGQTFRVEDGISTGVCPSCGAPWQTR